MLASSEMCDTFDRAAYYHILGLEVGGFIPDPALGWLGDKGCRFDSQLKVKLSL
jgi:hypothetical protein